MKSEVQILSRLRQLSSLPEVSVFRCTRPALYFQAELRKLGVACEAPQGGEFLPTKDFRLHPRADYDQEKATLPRELVGTQVWLEAEGQL